MSSIVPLLRSPFTDLTGCLINHQTHDKCATMEMNMMECLEAYGVDRGQKMCVDLIADFKECAGMTKQFNRIKAMKKERLRQYLTGELKKDELFPPPPRVDAY